MSTIDVEGRRSPLIGWGLCMGAAAGLVAVWSAAPPSCSTWLQSAAALVLLVLTGVALVLAVLGVRHHRRRRHWVWPLVIVSVVALGFACVVARWVFFVPCVDVLDAHRSRAPHSAPLSFVSGDPGLRGGRLWITHFAT